MSKSEQRLKEPWELIPGMARAREAFLNQPKPTHESVEKRFKENREARLKMESEAPSY